MPEINIGRLKGGFVVYWLEDGRRTRFRLKASNRQAAKAEGQRVWEASRKRKGHQLTFQDLKDLYVKYLGNRRTAHQVEEVWRQMGPALGSFCADQINDEVIEDFLKERQKTALEHRGRVLSNGTLFADVNIAQCILNYAKKKVCAASTPLRW